MKLPDVAVTPVALLSCTVSVCAPKAGAVMLKL